MSEPFSAALLAGGRSTRMGEDKAFLRFGDPPQPLWERQLGLLDSLGASQLLLSQNASQDFPQRPGVEAVTDARGDCGPLGGLVSCLRRSNYARLLVLAVDLPFVTSEFLASLQDRPTGVVLQDPESGRFEPVVAVYEKVSLPRAEERLRAGNFAMREFIAACVEARELDVLEIGEEQRGLLRNLNRPEDLD